VVGSHQGIARRRQSRGRVSGHSSPGAPEAPEGPQVALGLDGPEGNERLTAMTGAVLLIGLAVECYTILRDRPPAHTARLRCTGFRLSPGPSS
jgi:hypothetical protein